MRFTYL